MYDAKRREWTEDEKRWMVGHIEYEYQMLFRALMKLRENLMNDAQSTLEKQYSESNYLESYLLHARVLFEFYYKSQSEKMERVRDDDCIAEDYIDKAQTFYIERVPKEELESAIERINKEMAHLSYDRLGRTPKKSWSIMPIHEMIQKTTTAFYRSLPEYRKAYFSSIFDQLQNFDFVQRKFR